MLQSQGFDLTYKELHILLLTLNVNGNFNLAHPKEWEVGENTITLHFTSPSEM